MTKFLKLSTILFLLLSISLGSCKRTEEDPIQSTPTTPTSKTGTLKCKVDGYNWESNERSTKIIFFKDTIYSVEASTIGDTITINAYSSGTNDTSAIFISTYLKSQRVGTYTTNSNNCFITYSKGIDFNSIYGAFNFYYVNSTLTITKYDPTNHKISGTFSSTLTRISNNAVSKITEGSFTDVYLEEK